MTLSPRGALGLPYRPTENPCPCVLGRSSEPLSPTGNCGLEGGWYPPRGLTVGAFLFQNYMTPLRQVLSPADVTAIFINLEVRAPGGGLPVTVPASPGEGRPCRGPGWLVLRDAVRTGREEGSNHPFL